MYLFITFVLLVAGIRTIGAVCSGTFPLSTGTWRTSNRGTWTVDNTNRTLTNFEVTLSQSAGPTQIVMNCHDDTDTDGYIVFKSSKTKTILSRQMFIYACIKFEQQSTTDAYYFFIGSGLTLTPYERIIALPESTSFSISSHCNDKSKDPDRTHVAIKDGSEEKAALTCPTTILGTFSYSDTSCNSTFLDVCTTQTEFNFNYTVCAEQQIFSARGKFYCVYNGTNAGYNYLTLYNRETPSGSTFQYSCMVYSTSDITVQASINPKECLDATQQTPTTTNYTGGVTRTFTNYADSPCYINSDNASSSTTNLLWLYILIAILVIIIIIAIIVFVIWYIRKKRKKEQKKSDEESMHSSDESEDEQPQLDEEHKSEVQGKHEEERGAILDERMKLTEDQEDEDKRSVDSGFEQDRKEESPPEQKDEKEDKGLTNQDVTDIPEQIEINTTEDDHENETQKKETDDTSNSIQNDEEKDKENQNEEEVKQASSDNEKDKTTQAVTENVQLPDNDQISRDESVTNGDNASENIKDDLNSSTEDENKSIVLVAAYVADKDENMDDTKDQTYDNNLENNEEIEKEAVVKNNSAHNSQCDSDSEKSDDVLNNNDVEKNEHEDESDTSSERSEHELQDRQNSVKESGSKIKDENKEKQTTPDTEQSWKEKTERSSSVTSSDPEEIERHIRQIGMRKTTNFTPIGSLSKVLVSRQLDEENNRKNKENLKWRRIKGFFRGKTKKIQVTNQNNGDKDRQVSTPDTATPHREQLKAPFLKEYQYKKNMEQILEDRQFWGRKENYEDRFEQSDDEEFVDVAQEENSEVKNKQQEHGITQVEEIPDKTVHVKRSRDEQAETLVIEVAKSKETELKEDRAKDSGIDSPEFRKESADLEFSDEDEELALLDMTEPPTGYIKDSTGQIIRQKDGKIMTEKEMQLEFPLARVGMLFHAPRLKRTESGRPTGEYIEDMFGPNGTNDTSRNSKLESGEYSRPKHIESSRRSGGKDTNENSHKYVAFKMEDNDIDLSMIEENKGLNKKDSNITNSKLLRKRLFRNRRKRRSQKAGDQMSTSDRQVELNDLVRVIPSNSAQANVLNGRVLIPGTVISRNDSMKNKYDPELGQMYREGLATDKRILERSSSLKPQPPIGPREAFVAQDPDSIRIHIDSDNDQDRLDQDSCEFDSDDEQFLTENNRQSQERLFTYVRRPGQTANHSIPGSHDSSPSKHHHDMRHSLPWSIINQYKIRESSILDANSSAKELIAPKSADNAKCEMDDRRLKMLLEELYKDKKYFDHVIETTEPNAKPIIDERDLAEHGREYLLKRADFWDEKGSLPPRPPQTSLGLRLSRMQTSVTNSGRVSNISEDSTIQSPEHLQHTNDIPQTHKKRENTFS